MFSLLGNRDDFCHSCVYFQIQTSTSRLVQDTIRNCRREGKIQLRQGWPEWRKKIQKSNSLLEVLLKSIYEYLLPTGDFIRDRGARFRLTIFWALSHRTHSFRVLGVVSGWGTDDAGFSWLMKKEPKQLKVSLWSSSWWSGEILWHSSFPWASGDTSLLSLT